MLVLLAILTFGIGVAQNANRHGFFLEFGAGGLVGSTPRTSIFVEDNVVYYKCLSGAAIDLGFGGRFRISNNWAYEVKAEALMPLRGFINDEVFKFYPVGFRYTTSELWRNYSLFFHFNLGCALAPNRGLASGLTLGNGHPLYPNTSEIKLKGYDGECGIGTAYSFGIGANITTHFYVEGCFNAQTIFNSYGKNGYGVLTYGVPAIVFGYRFF